MHSNGTGCVVASAAVAATLALSAPAAASVPASLAWSAPLSCPGRELVLERLRPPGGAVANTASIDVQVVIEQQGEDRLTAQVLVVRDHQWTTRSLANSSCDALVDAIVVIIKVAALPQAGAAPGEPSLTPPPPVSGPPAIPPDLHAPSSRGSFGVGRQLVVTTDTQASVQWGSAGAEPLVLLAPTVDVFLGHGFSVGATLVYEHERVVTDDGARAVTIANGQVAESPETVDVNGLGIGGRAGYAIPWGERATVWPVATVTYERTGFDASGVNEVLIDAFAPLLFHPVPHAFVGLGPDFAVGFVEGQAPAFQYGLRLTVGAWIDLGKKGSS
jgi:hypothetical protein